MGLFRTLLILSLALSTGCFAYLAYSILGDHPIPEIKDEFWGPGSRPGVIPGGKEDESIHPFKIDFTSPSVLNELKSRLKQELDSSRLTPPLEGVSFEYGFNTRTLQSVISYWLNKYDFAKREAYLNRYPHFKTKIGGLDIHFQHVKPSKESTKKYKKTVPIIFIHGFPGSFVEYQKLIQFFLEPKNSDINFEIVIPSLPGYGFSQASSRPGMSPLRMANILGRLMKRLGYDKYYTLGEDWGTMIATDMGILYPDRVKGTHFSCYSLHPMDQLKQFLATLVSPTTVLPNERVRERFLPASKMLIYSIRESGYLHIQATKPDTIGVALNQSPTGLAAYILEKFSTWTNEANIGKEDGGLTTKFTMDELLDNVMVYWVAKSITASMRLYSETFHHWNTFKVPVMTPTSCISTVEDVITSGEIGLSSKYPNLKLFTAADEGGHFVSYEAPHLVAKPALEFINKIESGAYDKKSEL